MKFRFFFFCLFICFSEDVIVFWRGEANDPNGLRSEIKYINNMISTIIKLLTCAYVTLFIVKNDVLKMVIQRCLIY